MGISSDMTKNERELIMQRNHLLCIAEDIKKENCEKMFYNEKVYQRLNTQPVYRQEQNCEERVHHITNTLDTHKKETYYILPNGTSFDLREVTTVWWVDNKNVTPRVLINVRNNPSLCQKCANPIIMHDLCKEISKLVKEAKE